MSRLEKFIKDNRAAFDEALPSEKLWDKVEGTVMINPQTRILDIVESVEY